jgi:transcriptional regulator with XRE-family HTH domain
MHEIIHLTNNVGFNIKRLREQKGYSQEFMAAHMDITQATYARIESEDIKLTVDRLQKIAEVLDADISAFFDSSKLTIHSQTNNEGAFGNGYIENLHIENKETVKN